MMLRKILGLVAIVVVFAACSKLKENPVIDFVMKNFKVESTTGCDPAVSGAKPCALYDVKYAAFLGLDTAVRQSINERVFFILNGSQGPGRPLQEMGSEFMKEFDQFTKDMPDYGLSWYFKGYVEVMISSDTLISLRVDSESFTGGAHASYNTSFVNVDPKTGTAYLLDAMLREGYEDELSKLAQDDLQEQLGLNDNDSVDAPDFPEEKFKLNDNYGFRKEGIIFFFNDYEVPSFAEGPTEILIPYEKLQDWIR